jgi:hypothetical protein
MKSSEPQPRGLLYVTGMGMVASLGFDVATCCAAARAGLSRAQPFATYPVNTGTSEDAGLTCHSVPIATQGFEGDPRLLRLATMALRDLDLGEPWLRDMARGGCYLSLPPQQRVPASPSSVAASVALSESAEAWDRAQSLWLRAVAPLKWRVVPALRHVAPSGHTGFLRAIEQASRDLLAGLIDVAVVGGLDSLLDVEYLGWLESTGRLKTPVAPAGLQPGEAAAFLVIEADAHASERGAARRAVLRGLAFGQEPHLLGQDDPPSGKALASALHEAMRGIHFKHQLPLWVLSDHTGEPYRAMDWGNAAVHLESAHKAQVVGEMSFVAASFGDTGAASGAIALCIAATAFGRGYAAAPIAALVSSADSGDRAVLLCQAA